MWGVGAAVALAGVTIGACDGSSSGGVTSTSGPGGTSMTDPQIVGVLQAVNSGEVQEGQLAQQRATHPLVQAYAGMMIADHGYADQSIGLLGITAEQTSVSQQLTGTTAQDVAQLQGLSGPQFDRQYVQIQLQDHQAALQTLDQLLAGSGGTSGTSGTPGSTGTTGTGTTGTTGTGTTGTSGLSGTSGSSGSSGVSGTSGAGTLTVQDELQAARATVQNHILFAQQLLQQLGSTGTSGTSGTSGVTGTSGTSGTGSGGVAGTTGATGTSGGPVVY